MYLCLTILAAALAEDLREGRIPRQLVGFGVLASQAYVLSTSHSVTVALRTFAAGICLMLVLFPLFSIGALGGGDCKLMIMLPAFLGIGPALSAVFLSLAAGAGIGTFRLVSQGIFKERLVCFVNYLREVNATGRIGKYDLPASSTGGKMAAHQIHFTIPLFIGVAVVYGGLIGK